MKPKSFFCTFVLLFTSISILGQSKTSAHFTKNRLQLKRQNPDGWFRLLVPKIAGKVEPHASVDGGFFTTEKLQIDYIYWKYKNTPNPFRDASGNYSKSPMLACFKKSQTKTLRTRIDGKKAIVQTCVEPAKQKNPEFVYYVTFPKIKIGEYEGESSGYGMFNLTITYKNRRYLHVAERIVRSLNFDK